MHKTPTRPFKHHSKRDSVEFLRKKKQRKVCLCIRHLFRNKWGSWRSEEGAEWGRVMPVFVQVKCGGRWGVLCVRNCGATTESACAVRGWVLHRLNRLGHSGLSSRMRECILGQQWHVFESWRVSEGAGVGTSLCSLCWVESHQMKRGLILFRLFWHMHSNKLTRHFSPGKSCVLMQFHPGLVSTGWYLSQFMSVCLCLCVRRVGSIVSAHCWRFFSLLTCCWHLGGPLIVIETSDPLVVFES